MLGPVPFITWFIILTIPYEVETELFLRNTGNNYKYSDSLI